MKKYPFLVGLMIFGLVASSAWAQGISWDKTDGVYGRFGFGIGTVPNSLTIPAYATTTIALSVPRTTSYDAGNYNAAIVTIRGGSRVLTTTDLVASATMSGSIASATFTPLFFQTKDEADYYVANHISMASPDFFVYENTHGALTVDNVPGVAAGVPKRLFTKARSMGEYGSYRIPVIPGGFMVFHIQPDVAAGGHTALNLAGIWVNVQFYRRGG